MAQIVGEGLSAMSRRDLAGGWLWSPFNGHAKLSDHRKSFILGPGVGDGADGLTTISRNDGLDASLPTSTYIRLPCASGEVQITQHFSTLVDAVYV